MFLHVQDHIALKIVLNSPKVKRARSSKNKSNHLRLNRVCPSPVLRRTRRRRMDAKPHSKSVNKLSGIDLTGNWLGNYWRKPVWIPFRWVGKPVGLRRNRSDFTGTRAFLVFYKPELRLDGVRPIGISAPRHGNLRVGGFKTFLVRGASGFTPHIPNQSRTGSA